MYIRNLYNTDGYISIYRSLIIMTFELAVKWLVFCFLVAMTGGVSFYFYVNLVKGWVAKEPVQVVANYATAAIFSLLVVLTLNFTAGEIAVDAWGLSFKGSSGPIVFWILCFLASITGFSSLNKKKA